MSDTSLQDDQDSPHSSGTSLDEAASVDQVDLDDEAVSLTELVTPEMHQVKEFEEILKMVPEPPIEDQLKLYDVPEISALFEGAVSRVQQHFSSETVNLELRNIYQILAVSRRNEASLKDRLQKKEDELSQLYQKMRRDPRIYRALVLASSWRREKNTEVQTCKEYEATMDVMKADMRDLESKIHNLQNVNNRIYKDLQKIPKLEDSIRCLEEVVLKKENIITILQTELDTHKRHDGPDALGDADNLKNMYEATTAEVDKMMTPAQIQKNCKLKVAELKADHKRQVNELSVALQSTRCSEIAAKHNYKCIVASVKSMKQQLNKLESNLEVSSRNMLRLVEAQEQSEKTIADLEYQIRNMRLREEGLQQLLVASHRKNDRLKAKLGSLATVGKLKFEHESLVKSFGEKEREIAICGKNEHKLEKELKFLNIQLAESKRLRETQQRDLNNTKQLVAMSKSNLTEAVRYNDVLFKRLEWTEAYLKYYQRRFDACTGDNIDIMNTLKHLGSLCKEHEATIRIKDARNDSLVLSLSNLEDVLKDAYTKINNLRQANLISQTNHLRQMELNDMMTQLLKFTEAEKTSAVNECNKNVDTVLLLQKQLVQRMNRIAAQYKDICDLKATIEKHLQMLDLQKKETNALRDVLDAIRKEDVIQKNKLKSLTKERDAFGAIVIEKNIIVQLLEKKISLLEKLIERGATHYRRRTDDIRLLKLEVKNLRHKLAARETTADMNTELRQELVRTCRQLQLEQGKRKAIEELKAPQPHRYVTLKCRDPSQYEQIVKIHKLQRLLIVKYQENTSMENAIINKDMQIQKMKLLLVRRIGEDIHEQFHNAKITISQRTRQVKSLLSEVNVLTFDLKESRQKLSQVLEELKVAKEEIAKHKRQSTKDSSQHALTAEDSRKRPRMPTDDSSVAFYRSRFKLRPLPIALQHQQQHRMKQPIHIEDSVSDKADRLISGSYDLQTRGL